MNSKYLRFISKNEHTIPPYSEDKVKITAENDGKIIDNSIYTTYQEFFLKIRNFLRKISFNPSE